MVFESKYSDFIFIQQNVFEIVVCQISMSRFQFVDINYIIYTKY